MKKIMFFVAAMAVMSFASCNQTKVSANDAENDTTVVDTAAVDTLVADSVVAE